MYISKLKIQNYRCFNEDGVEIEFSEGLNVIIGETIAEKQL
jgi:predicted ATP-dependent endonuclease of OLD family